MIKKLLESGGDAMELKKTQRRLFKAMYLLTSIKHQLLRDLEDGGGISVEQVCERIDELMVDEFYK